MLRPFLILAFFFIAQGVYASHLIGGELSYVYTSGSNFDLKLTLYRDCGPTGGSSFDSQVVIGVYDSSGTLVQTFNITNPTITQVPAVNLDPCLSNPPNVCVEKAVYQSTVSLPPIPGGYDIVYQRCCRVPTVINIQQPDRTGSTYHAHVPDPALAASNTSPTYAAEPPQVICVNSSFVYDHSVTDPDGDSLVYAFVTPLAGGSTSNPLPNPPSPPPFSGVTWTGGYSANYQIDASPALAIDPLTGIITGRPTQIGQYAFAVSVKEFRNGVEINESIRDFRLDIAQCQTNVQADIAPRDSSDYCNGLTVTFNNNSQNSSAFYWDFGDPNNSADSSSQINPVYTYSDTGVYTVMLVAEPVGGCADTHYLTIDVRGVVYAEFQAPPDQCLDQNAFDFEGKGNILPGSSFFWDFGQGATPQTSTLQNPTGVVYATPGQKTITYILSRGPCKDTILDTVFIEATPIVEFSFDAGSGCAPVEINFENISQTTDTVTYLWNFGDGTTSTEFNPNHIYNDTGTFSITLSLTSNSVCTGNFSFGPVQVQVKDKPTARFSAFPESTNLLEPSVSFVNESPDASFVQYEFPNGDFRLGDSVNYTFTKPGIHWVKQYVESSSGCSNFKYLPVRIDPAPVFIPNAFTPNGDLLNDEFAPVIFSNELLEIEIYDRWGHLIFNEKGLDAAWNGYNSLTGNPSPAGLYVYKIRFQQENQKPQESTGRVMLIR